MLSLSDESSVSFLVHKCFQLCSADVIMHNSSCIISSPLSSFNSKLKLLILGHVIKQFLKHHILSRVI